MLSKLLYEKWKKLVVAGNRRGVPLPTVRDPRTGIGSVSLTLVFISSVLVIAGIVGKWSNMFETIDINSAMEFFYASAALYFGRQWQNRSAAKEDSMLDNPDSDPK